MLNKVLKHRLALVLIVILILFSGIATLFQLPRREIPLIEHPIALVTTVYPGATANQVEKYVTEKLESEFSHIIGIDNITSISQPGLSQITIKADPKMDVGGTWDKVDQKIDLAKMTFPSGVQESSLETDLQMQGVSIYQLVALAEEDLFALEELLGKWEPAFNQMAEIGQVQIQGMPRTELLVEIEQSKMLAAKLRPNEIMQLIKQEISPSPPGNWVLENTIYQLRIKELNDIRELLHLSLPAKNGQADLRLGDIVDIREVLAPKQELVSYQGQPSVALSFFASSGVDLVKVDREVSQLIGEMALELPENIELHQVYTQANAISNMFRSLGLAFLIALFFVVFISSAGLNRYAALSVVITIPVALCAGLLALPLVNVDMNQITLIAFIIVLGILVDDAIVVNENISRYRLEQNTVLTSVLEGTKDVASSVIISTLIIIFAFSPLWFLSGGAGDFIRPLPTVIIATILASTLAALFIIPIYRHWLEERFRVKEKLGNNGWLDKGLGQLQVSYENKLIPKVLKNPWKYVAFCLILSMFAYLLVPIIPKEFFPDVERTEIFVEIQLPKTYALAATREKVSEIEDYILAQKGISQVNSFYATPMPRIFGMSNANAVGENSANMLIFVDIKEVKSRHMKDYLAKELNKEFPLVDFTFSVVESGPPIGAPMSMRLTGNSLEEMQALSDEIKDLLLSQPGVIGVSDDFGVPSPTLTFQANETNMRLHKISQGQIGEALRLYGEGIKFGEFATAEELHDVRLKYKDSIIESNPDLSKTILFNNLGQAIPLNYVVDINTNLELMHITHYNHQRSNTIRTYLDGTTSANKFGRLVIPDIDRIVALHPDIYLEYGGESVARTEAFVEISQIFIIVIFLLLLVMVIQFRSIPLALIIMATVLLSSSGALYSLFITWTPLGFMSMMGVVSLAGVVVRNGIILVEFMEQRLNNNMDLYEAVKLAGGQRLRPILLTTGTSFFGLMPLVLGKNLLFKPLAICIAGGLLYSTIFTLILIPCAYYLYRRRFPIESPLS
ncbi:MAG TPA: efflux RND transporter permease subunit [Syntrophomonadaceae bacterium]|nr:efflux RND transporter permease subunit [Syntrophomonadaceae bacterium]